MRIENQPSVTRAAAGKAGTAKRTGFSSLFEQDGPSAAQTTMPVGLIGGIYSVDSDADAATGRSRGLHAAHGLLDDLEHIRRNLLIGGVSGARLQALASRLDYLQDPADPALASILGDIRLRVAVEIAKLSPHHIAACRLLAGPV